MESAAAANLPFGLPLCRCLGGALARPGPSLICAYLTQCDRSGKLSCIEGGQVLHPLTDSYSMHRQAELCRNCDQDSPPCGAIQLGHDQSADPGPVLEHLDLVEGILTGCRIQHQEHLMGRARVD